MKKIFSKELIYILFLMSLKLLNIKSSMASIILIGIFITADIYIKGVSGKLLLYSMFSPYYIFRQLFIIYLIIKLFLIKKNIFIDKNSNKIKFYFIYLILINCISLVKDLSLTPFLLFGITTLCGYMSYVIFINNNQIDIVVFERLCILQIIPVIYTFIITKINGTFHPDCIIGTTSHANILAILLLINLIIIIFDKKIKRTFKFKIIITHVFMLMICDAKLIIFCYICALIVYYIITHRYRISYLKLIITFFIATLIISISLLNISKIKNLIDEYNIESYLYDQSRNKKVQAYITTFNNLDNLEKVIGIGCGRYGSKVANALASEVMYKGDYSIELPNFIKRRVNNKYFYIASMFTEEFHTRMQGHSGILSYPMSNYITIFGEQGVLGLLFILIFFISNIYTSMKIKNNSIGMACSILIIFTLIIMVFDNFLEMNEYVILIGFILSIKERLLFKGENNG